VTAVSDRDTDALNALFNTDVGRGSLARRGVDDAVVDALSSFGLSSICNMVAAIKAARALGLGPDDVVVTICTDAIDRYYSVMSWLEGVEGKMDGALALGRVESTFRGQKLDYIQEGDRLARERWHNLKYYTWVEQQGKTVEELDAQRDPGWWRGHQEMAIEIDRRILDARGQQLMPDTLI
jgi:hypothetical protein